MIDPECMVCGIPLTWEEAYLADKLILCETCCLVDLEVDIAFLEGKHLEEP